MRMLLLILAHGVMPGMLCRIINDREVQRLQGVRNLWFIGAASTFVCKCVCRGRESDNEIDGADIKQRNFRINAGIQRKANYKMSQHSHSRPMHFKVRSGKAFCNLFIYSNHHFTINYIN